MKRLLRPSLLLLSAASFLFLHSLSQSLWSAETPNYKLKVEKNVASSMRDGIKLYADIYRPDIPDKVPVILIRTPYNKEHYGGEFSFARLGAQNGYAVIVQDVRGRFSSKGEFLPYVQELNDGYDAVEWSAGLPFSNGKVGTDGCSYLGADQWQAAVMNPPHLVAIFPQCTFSNARHFFFFGGTFDLSWISWLNGRLPDIKRHHGIMGKSASEEAADIDWAAHKWEWLSYLPLKDFPLLKDFCPYYYDWIAHPDDGPFWDFANVEKKHSEVSVPAYNLSGWFDDGYGQPGAIRNFLGMRKNGKTAQARDGQKLIIGPWTHCEPASKAGPIDYGQEAAVNVNELALRWFDYWLKGIDNGIMQEPPIKIFVMGDNKWRSETEWPLARAKRTFFYLGGSGPANSSAGQGKLSQQPVSGDGHDHYTYDPANPVTDYFFEEPGPRDLRPIEIRNDVLVYTTPPLTK